MLELRDVTRRFGELTALDQVTLQVRPGEVVGFVGPNGAGKTTAMRIAMGLLAPSEGSATWEGTPIDRKVTRRRFGYLPEERGLYPKMAVRPQLEHLARLSGVERASARRVVQGWLERIGLAERADDAVEELSLGNQQRVQLVAAVVHEPSALVLDEPFSGLDPVGVDVMAATLREVVDRGAAVVFSSHQLELVERMCDRVWIIRDGRIVADGTVGTLRAGHAVERVVLGAAWLDATVAASLEGVVGVERAGDRLLLDLGPGVRPDDVLDAARRLGPVRHFSVHEPSLAELYRAMVAA